MDFKTLISLYLCIVYVHGQPINQVSVIERRIVNGCTLLNIKTAKGLPSTLGIGHCCDDTKTTSFLATKSITSAQTTKITFKTLDGKFILAEKNSKIVFEPFKNGSTPALRHYFIIKDNGRTILSPASKPGYWLDADDVTETVDLINYSTPTSYIEAKTRAQSRCTKVMQIPNYCSTWKLYGSCKSLYGSKGILI